MAIRFPSTELILSRDVVAIDVEATGLYWWKDRAFSLSMSWYDNTGHDIHSFYADFRDEGVIRWLRDHIPRLKFVVNHYIKYDAHMLREAKMPLPEGAIGCTMVREALIDENRHAYDLDSLSWKYLGEGKEDIWPKLAELFGGEPKKEVQAKNLIRAPRSLVETYCNKDSSNALRIWMEQEKIIDEENLQRVDTLEQRLLGAVIEMERGGVKVDLPRAEQSADELDKLVVVEQKKLDRMAGGPINVNSPIQVKKLLGVYKNDDGNWMTKDGTLLEPTESGNSGSLPTAKLYQCQLPEAGLIADIRSMIKAKDVFLRKYCLSMSHKSYIHANINQTRTEDGDGTYTGRFSITDPALQQIHKRNKKMAAIVRSCFIPDEGDEWGCYDWAQMDFRVMAHYANDPKIVAAYQADPATDFHRIVSELTGLPRDRDQKTGGANAKQMNLGLAFNMGAGRMAKEMNLPYSVDENGYLKAGPEAWVYFNKYHKAIPGPSRLKDEVAALAKRRGYIMTMMGRRLRFRPSETYKASGILYQAMAAEALKIKIIEVTDFIKATPGAGRYLVPVHDEHDISLNPGRPATFDEDIRHILQRFDGAITPIKFRIPILADYGKGINWWEASK